ncbi:MAG: hypothetical protein KBD24_03155 [Candidatus Pacebacteria bacterium]|nr:hypothetical protein [Candidatus Paceibacterota bacterium]
MSPHSRPPYSNNRQSGNAVTLTLLGLAVAILAGVVVLYVVGTQRPVPVPVTAPFTEENDTTSAEVNPREGWRTYENEKYGFAFEYPQGWIVATGTILGLPVITAYDAGQPLSASSTFGVLETDTRLSVYPAGLPLEEFGDVAKDSTVVVAVPGASAKDYVLGTTTSRAWATVVRFDARPESWTADGFVFARAHVEEEKITHVRGENLEISPEEYDPYTGDHIVRYGFVDPIVRTTVEELLRSFHFKNDGAGETDTASSTADFIRVTTPLAGDRVTSPLRVAGEARGGWYFEGSFPVELRTSAGEVLAQVPATALGEWMTEDFVSFEISLVFASTTATSGVVHLVRDNPSGVSANDQSLDIPVIF